MKNKVNYYQLLCLLFIVILTSSSISAQSSDLRGFILEVGEDIAIPGVLVELEGTDYRAISQTDGKFKIKNVPFGEYSIRFKTNGYQTLTEKITVDENMEMFEVRIKELVSNLPGVTIVAGGRSGIKSIPGSVHYLSPKDLEKFSYTDINRVLRNVPGVNYQEEDGFGLRPNIGLRGSGLERSNKITVMEDGILAAPAPYSAPAAYYFPNVGRMHGVEVVMGASAIEHGPYTTGGAINFISSPIPDEFSGKMTVLGGRYGSRNIHATVGNSHKNVAYMVETLNFGSAGFKELDGGGDTGFDRKEIIAKVRVNNNPDATVPQSLTFKLGNAVETSDDTYLGLTREDFDQNPYRRYVGSQVDEMNTNHFQLSATHNVELSKKVKLTTVAYRNEFARNWYKLDRVRDSLGNRQRIANILDNPETTNDAYDVVTGEINSVDGALEVKANNREYYSQGVQTRASYEIDKNHEISASVRYHEDEADRFQWVDSYTMLNGNMSLATAGQPGTESNRLDYARAVASFVHYSGTFGRFTVTPGMRYENMLLQRTDFGKDDPSRTGADIKERSNHVSVFMPGTGLNYKLTENMDVYTGIHRGFTPPGSNPETNPEESWNYELGTRVQKKGFRLQSTAFYNDYANLLGSDLAAAGAVGTGDLFNGGQARAMGLEFFAVYDLMNLFNKDANFSIPLTINYTYTEAVFLNDFDSDFGEWGTVSRLDQLPYIAPHQLGIILGFNYKSLEVNLNARYMSEMRTIPGQGQIENGTRLDDYFVLDASVSYMVHKNVSVFGSVNNMTNQAYVVALRPSGLRPGMPLFFNLGLKANF